MINPGMRMKCPCCGEYALETRTEGLYCISCRKLVETVPSDVHHEHFPHMGEEKIVCRERRNAEKGGVHHEQFPHVEAEEPEA